MKKLKKMLVCCLFSAFAGCLLFVHRRVILAAIRGEELPEAPSWHCWCKKRA